MLRSLSFISSRCIMRCAVQSAAALNYTFQYVLPKYSCSVSGKDLPTPKQIMPVDKLYAHDADILREQLSKAKTIERVLELISMHVDMMNDKHIVEAFNMVHKRCGYDYEHLQTRANVINNTAFQKLCTRTMNRARFLETGDLILIFKTLSSLGVRPNTYIMQSILKLFGSHINDFSLGELIFLNFLLAKQKNVALVEGLKMALPLALQVQIDQQLNSENVNEVVGCFRMSSKARLKPATIEKIIAALLKKSSSLTPEHSVSIIFSLLHLEAPVDGYKQLLKITFNNVAENIEEINQKSLLDLVYACQKSSYYYRSFLLKLAKRIVAESWGLKECYLVMMSFCKLNFFSHELLELINKQIPTEREKIETDEKYSLLTIVEFFTFTNYQPPNVFESLNVLCSLHQKLNTMFEHLPHLFLKYVCQLVMLGYFNEELLKKVMDENFLFNTWSLSKKNGRIFEFEQNICCLQWASELYNQTDKIVIPASLLLKVNHSVQQKYLQSANYPLRKFLEAGLGGPQFFLSGVSTRNGHTIDHVIALRNGIYPVALDHSDDKSTDQIVTYIEDLHLPDDTKIITLVVGNKDYYCCDPEILKGWAALKLSSLAKMSYFPVIINFQNWYNLPDREKIPFLMREIKQTVLSENVNKTDALHL